MAPVFIKQLDILDIPIDFNKKLNGKPIFGQHKTYRGFIGGVIFSIAAVFIQKLLYPLLANYSLIDYSRINIFLLGFLLGFGALLGDLVKSFFKRRVNIPSGDAWVPFDQIDWIIGAIIFSSFIVPLTIKEILIIFAIFGLLHPIINLAGYLIGLKSNKF